MGETDTTGEIATMDDIVVSRLFGRCLLLAARKLGIERAEHMGLQALCERIIMGAQRGGIDPESYRVAWMMMRQSGPH